MKPHETVSWLKEKTSLSKAPSWIVVLGSGLGNFVDQMEKKIEISYKDIPFFPHSTVEGHKGYLVLGKFKGFSLAICQGRVHMYEGFSVEESVYALRVLRLWGAENVLLTNSVGGLDSHLSEGSFVVISDHINLTGQNPLIGQESLKWGLRFPDMTQVYNLKYQEKLKTALRKQKAKFHTGVYCGVLGPSYETPSEVQFLRHIGGSVVGMSTVCEAIASKHCGLEIAGLSCVTNKAAGLTKQTLHHKEVYKVAHLVREQFSKVLEDFFTLL